jgi:hypothetical protein
MKALFIGLTIIIVSSIALAVISVVETVNKNKPAKTEKVKEKK